MAAKKATTGKRYNSVKPVSAPPAGSGNKNTDEIPLSKSVKKATRAATRKNMK